MNIVTYDLPIIFHLKVRYEDGAIPDLTAEDFDDVLDVVIDNLNISDETNDMFTDSIQERLGDIEFDSFSFSPDYERNMK